MPRLPKRHLFLLTVAAVYAFVCLLRPELAISALRGAGEVFVRILPILILVFAIMFVVNRYLTPERIKRHIGAESGLRGWFYAVIGGIVVSGPPYVLYPLLGDLQKGGMKNSLIAVFLYNRNVKIPFVPVMVYYFGLAYTVVISALIILFSVFNGWLVGYLAPDKAK